MGVDQTLQEPASLSSPGERFGETSWPGPSFLPGRRLLRTCQAEAPLDSPLAPGGGHRGHRTQDVDRGQKRGWAPRCSHHSPQSGPNSPRKLQELQRREGVPGKPSAGWRPPGRPGATGRK